MKKLLKNLVSSRKLCTFAPAFDKIRVGGGDDILYTQFLTDGLDEGGLASTHLTIEGKDSAIANLVHKAFGRLADIL